MANAIDTKRHAHAWRMLNSLEGTDPQRAAQFVGIYGEEVGYSMCGLCFGPDDWNDATFELYSDLCEIYEEEEI